MTKEDLFKAVDGVDLKLIDSAVSYKPHKKIKLAIVGTAAAVLLVVFGTALVTGENINNLLNLTRTTTGQQISNEAETTMGVTYTEQSWDEKNITAKFPTVFYAGKEYSTLSYAEDKKTTKKIGNILSEEVAYGTRPSTEEESIKISVYSLENIAPEFMIAVKFEGHDGLYAYANGSFKVSSFGEFLSSTDFVNIVNFGDFTFGTGEIEHNKGELLGDKATLLSFFKDDMPWCEDDTAFAEALIEIRVDAPEIGISNRVFDVFANGIVQTNLFNHVPYTFKMSEDDFKRFKNYISSLKEKITESEINNSFESSEITTQVETTVPLIVWE